MAWGGRRPGAGRKPNPNKPVTRAENKVPSLRPTVPATPKSDGWNQELIASIIEASERYSRTKTRTADQAPFRVAEHPPAAMPPQGMRMAMDDSLNWASGEWAQAAFGNLVSEGLLFLGYPYLAELAQRPEYRVISETIADDATRKWIDFEITGNEEQKERARKDPEGEAERQADPDERKKRLERSGKMDKVKALKDDQERLEMASRFYGSCRNDGFFGRSHFYIDLGQDIDGDPEELKTDIGKGTGTVSKSKVAGQRIRALKVVEPVWCYPTAYNATNPLADNWYNPDYWYVMGKQIHRTRLMPFVGRPVPDMLKPAYSFGGLSLSQMAQPYVDRWLTTVKSVSELIHAFSVMVLSTDMQTILQPGNAAGLIARAAMFNALRDNQGIFLLNKATEDFKNVSASLSGLHELQAQSQEHMSIPAGVKIETARGPVPIEKVTSYDRVLTRAGFAPIKWAGITGTSDALVEIEVAGSILPTTGNHPIWSESIGEFVNAENVSLSHRLLGLRSRESMGLQSRGAVDGGGALNAAIITTKRRVVSFIASCGKRIEDLSRAALKSITLTMTALTTNGTILSFSPVPFMRSSMDISARTDLLKAMSASARSAAPTIRHSSHATEQSAVLVEGVSIDRVCAVKVPRQLVYDIIVADGWPPEFFANGILVHNCSVVRIPLVKFTGISPSGLNASSEGEIMSYDDTIGAYQERLLRPPLKTLVNFQQLSLFEEIDPELTFVFKPLRVMTEKEKGEIQKQEMERDSGYIDAGVLAPEEVRGRLIDDPEMPFADLDPDDLPDLKQEEEEGLEPEGGRPNPLAGGGPTDGGPGGKPAGGAPKGPGGASDEKGGTGWDAVIPFAHDAAEWEEGKHPRSPDGKFGAGSSAPVFHGSQEKFTKFDLTKAGKTDPGHLGRGAYFSTDPRVTNTSLHKMEARLNIKSPLEVSLPDMRTDKRDVVRGALGLPRTATAEDVTAELKKRGNDSVILDYSPIGYAHQEIMVLDPDNIEYVRHFEKIAADEWKETDHPRADNGQFGSGGGGAPLKASEMKKVGPQMGSNTGGVFEDKGGKQFYVKAGQSKEHVQNERMAAALYGLAGVRTLKYLDVEGGNHVATEMEKLDKKLASEFTDDEVKAAHLDFAAHAWLANWDAVGTGYDNLGVIEGKPAVLDTGGALKFRAQGEKKGSAFGSRVDEWRTLRDKTKNSYSHSVFGKITSEDLVKSADQLSDVADDEIKAVVAEHGGDDKLAQKIIERRNDILRKAYQLVGFGPPKSPDATVVFNEDGKRPVEELNGIKFEAWSPPKDWNDVDGQLDIDGEEEFVVPKGKTPSTGVVITEPDGRVWLMRPSGGYGGYENTFPKGGLEKGLSLQANAIKEAWEETGLKVNITGHLGDGEGDTTYTRYYSAKRVGGDPMVHEWESEGVALVPKAKLKDFVNRKRDHAITDYLHSQGNDQAMDEPSFQDSEHPRDEGGKFTFKGTGSAKKTEEAPTGEPQEEKSESGKAKKTAFGGLWKLGGGNEKENVALNIGHVLAKPTNAGSSYRQMLAFMVKKAQEHGLDNMVAPVKGKLGEAYQLAGEKAYQLMNAATDPKEQEKYQKIVNEAAAKIKELGWTKPNAGVAAPFTPAKPAVQATPPAPKPAVPPPSSFPAPTEQELAKAKKAVPLSLQYVPGAGELTTAAGTTEAQKLVAEFNEKYAGKDLSNDKPALIQKVNDFKSMGQKVQAIGAIEKGNATVAQQALAAQQAQKIAAAKTAQAEANKKQADALKAAHEASKAKNKEYMKALGISETEASGFEALVEMMGVDNSQDLVQKFESYQQEAEQHGYPISGFQYALIRDYINGGYATINPALRAPSWSPKMQVYTNLVNKAIDKMPKFAGTVERGTTLPQSVIDGYVAGHIVTEKAFTSTGIGFSFSGNVKYSIKAHGMRGGDFSKGANKSEKEVLFKAGTQFLVHKVETKNGVTHIEMEEVEHYG